MKKLTLASRCRISKTLLYVIEHQFCNLNDVYHSGFVSKNWYDVKSSLEFLSNCNIIQSTRDPTVVYFARRFLVGPKDLIHAEYLSLKNEISHMIKSEAGFHSTVHGKQLAKKFLAVYSQMIMVMNLEYRKQSATGNRHAETKKIYREGEIVNFLQRFGEFLHEDNRLILSGQLKTLVDLSARLDSEFYHYQNYYKKLKQNANHLHVSVKTYYHTLLQTKKDASEIEGVSMKQVSNRIKPYTRPDGSPDIEKMYLEGMVESGRGMLYSPVDESFLLDLYETRQALQVVQKGKERERIRKEAKMLFPGITFQ